MAVPFQQQLPLNILTTQNGMVNTVSRFIEYITRICSQMRSANVYCLIFSYQRLFVPFILINFLFFKVPLQQVQQQTVRSTTVAPPPPAPIQQQPIPINIVVQSAPAQNQQPSAAPTNVGAPAQAPQLLSQQQSAAMNAASTSSPQIQQPSLSMNTFQAVPFQTQQQFPFNFIAPSPTQIQQSQSIAPTQFQPQQLSIPMNAFQLSPFPTQQQFPLNFITSSQNQLQTPIAPTQFRTQQQSDPMNAAPSTPPQIQQLTQQQSFPSPINFIAQAPVQPQNTVNIVCFFFFSILLGHRSNLLITIVKL